MPQCLEILGVVIPLRLVSNCILVGGVGDKFPFSLRALVVLEDLFSTAAPA